MLGLFSLFVHGAPGFEAIKELGLRDPQSIVNTQEWLAMEFINGICWCAAYGATGLAIDWLREIRNRHS